MTEQAAHWTMTSAALPPEPPGPDKRVVQCNYREATSECREGARAYLICTSLGSSKPSAARVNVLAKSRSGRWIRKWESVRRLTAFRYKTIPPEHPVYSRLYDTRETADGLETLNRVE